MKHRSFYIVAIILFLFVIPGRSQDTKVVGDLNLWSGVGIEKSFLDDWNISLKQELRLHQDMSEINNFFTQAGLEYRISKNFEIEGRYRYIRNHKRNGAYENKSRYSLGLKYSGDINFISVQYRIKYQKEIEGFQIYDIRQPSEKYLRHRLTIRYNDIKRIKPYISGEIFQRFVFAEFPQYDCLRMMVGLQYKAGKIGYFKASYGVDRELNNIIPYTFYIVKLNYTYKF